MKRGIRFEIPNQHGRFIAEILQPIDYKKYKWHIDRSEIWTSCNVGVPLFTDQYIGGHEFFELVNIGSYYMIFGVIKAFPQSALITKISKFEEFIESECEVILLVADSSFVDIYCKDKLLIDKLYNNAKSRSYKKLEYIDENDSRTGMYV